MSITRGQSNSGESFDDCMESNFNSFSPNNANQKPSSDQPSMWFGQSSDLGPKNDQESPSSLPEEQNHDDIVMSLAESRSNGVSDSTSSMISENDSSNQNPNLSAENADNLANNNLSDTIPTSAESLNHVFSQHHHHPITSTAQPEWPPVIHDAGLDMRTLQTPFLFNPFATGNTPRFGFIPLPELLHMRLISASNMEFVPSTSRNPPINPNLMAGIPYERTHLFGFSHHPPHENIAFTRNGFFDGASNQQLQYNPGYQQWSWSYPHSGYVPWCFGPWNFYGSGYGLGSSPWNVGFVGPYFSSYGHLTSADAMLHSGYSYNPYPFGALFHHDDHHFERFEVPYTPQTMGAGIESDHRPMSEFHQFTVPAHHPANLPFQPVLINLADHPYFNALGLPEELFFPDRFSNMRLDTDYMSYEELLSLGDHIGNVSTGLTEETIMALLNRKSYEHVAASNPLSDDETCCICRGEYVVGEDIGVLNCGHEFHTDCIKLWLVIKNNCPICKVKGLGE